MDLELAVLVGKHYLENARMRNELLLEVVTNDDAISIDVSFE